MAKQKIQSDPKVLENQDESEQPKNSRMSDIIRFVLVALLAAYVLKPYFFDKQKADNSELQNFAVHGKTMGTTWNALVCTSATKLVAINNADQSQSSETEEAVDSCETLLSRIIQRELDKVDSIASTYRSNSEISKFNNTQTTDWFEVSPETAEIVHIALEVAKNTEGAFDPTVAPLVNLYRFGPNKSPLTALPSDEQVAAIRKNVGYEKLEVRLTPPALKKSVPELTVDLSGVAKGYAVDLAAKALENVGLDSYLIEVGGEIRCCGKKIDQDTLARRPWTLGIQTPEVVVDESNEQNTPDLYRLIESGGENASVLATSGDYRNFLQVGDVRFSHIIDPRSGKPTEIVKEGEKAEKRLGSVSILSQSADALSCAQADAFATALFVLGPEKGVTIAEQNNIAALFLLRADDSAAELSEVCSSAFNALGSKTLQEIQAQQNSEEDADE